MKKSCIALGASVLSALPVLADGAFDGSTLVTDATSSVSGIITAIATLMTTAIGLYVGFVAYRKLREGLNKA